MPYKVQNGATLLSRVNVKVKNSVVMNDCGEKIGVGTMITTTKASILGRNRTPTSTNHMLEETQVADV